jgi:hypothetical protein
MDDRDLSDPRWTTVRSRAFAENGHFYLSRPISLFCFFFLIYFHHCKVSCKLSCRNNYIIYTNSFFICNRIHMSYLLEVSRIFKYICYFIPFKWISACLPKVIRNWPICTSNKHKKIKIIFRRLWSIVAHILYSDKNSINSWGKFKLLLVTLL